MAGRHSLIQPSVAITTAPVLTRLTNIATWSVYISEIRLFATAGTLDQVVIVDLVTLTTDGAGGTSTGLMASRDNGQLDQWGGTYMVYDGSWSTEPTVGVVLRRIVANMAPGFHIWQPKPAPEPRFDAGTGVRFGLKVNTAPGTTITLGTEMDFYGG